jgi:hypothetical protein
VFLYTALDAALCLFAGVPIVLFDLRHHLITNSSLRHFGFALLVLKLIESKLHIGIFFGVFRDGLIALILFLCIYWLSGTSLGLGDVKLAGLLAALAGIGTIRNCIIWITIIWIWGGVHSLASAIRYRTLRRRIAFAPALFTGTLTYLAMRIWSSLPQ